MDLSLITISAMALLKPLLTKASEKASETFGEKLAENSLTKPFWIKVKSLFIKNEEKEIVARIEDRGSATNEEIEMIEHKLTEEISTNRRFAEDIKTSLNILPEKEFVITGKLKSIQRLQNEISTLELQMERAGIATVGDYQNKIDLQQKKMEDQLSEIYRILIS